MLLQTLQLRDLIDRITHDGCSSVEMSLAQPTATLHSVKQMVNVGETEFLDRIKVFKWRDVFMEMAVKILQHKGGLPWEFRQHGSYISICIVPTSQNRRRQPTIVFFRSESDTLICVTPFVPQLHCPIRMGEILTGQLLFTPRTSRRAQNMSILLGRPLLALSTNPKRGEPCDSHIASSILFIRPRY